MRRREVWQRLRERGIKVEVKVHPPPKIDEERARSKGMREIVYIDRVEVHIWQ